MTIAKNLSMLMLPLLLGTGPGFAQQQPAPAQQEQAAPPQNSPAPAPSQKKHTTADDNPFPEDISRKAAQGTDAPPAADKGPAAPGNPAGTDSSSSSSRSKFEGLGDPINDGDRVSNGAGGYVLNPKLAAEDVRVGGFYLQRRDYQGAYTRYKEATQVDPANADAVFGLAEAARGLNHKDEAVQNYLIYLDAFPDGKKSKDVRKVLADLGAS